MKYQYCCQNATEEILNHMIYSPIYYKVDKKYLYDCDEMDFIDGFSCLWSTVQLIYKDIIMSPADYGLPLVNDISYPSFNSKANESTNSSKRLVGLMGIIGQVGEMVNDELVVPIDQYILRLKALKSKDKITNADKILKKLNDFGIVISDFTGKSFKKGADTFTISFPDNRNMMKAWKGYMMTEQRRYEFYSLHYYLIIPPESLPENQHCITFGQYLNHGESEFFSKFNDRMMEEKNFRCESAFSYQYTLEYSIKDKDSYIVRCFSNGNILDIRMRLKNISLYISYIESLPLHIKKLFMVDSNCRKCTENCAHRQEWQMDNINYVYCDYDNQIHIKDYILDDVEYYINLIKLEADTAR